MASYGTIRLLRSEIKALRLCAGNDDSTFIPFEPLKKVLNKGRVQEIIKTCKDIPGEQSDEVINWICGGNLKTFAILILLKDEEHHILQFIQHDNFHKTAADSKLPLMQEALERILPNDVADDFYKIQWEFTAPLLCMGTVHRYINNRARLPYTRNEELADNGGFGKVYEIEIHPFYRKLLPVKTPPCNV